MKRFTQTSLTHLAACSLIPIAGLVGVTAPRAGHAESNVDICTLVLCLANPNGPTAVAQCVPIVLKFFRSLTGGLFGGGFSIPICHGVDQNGNDTGPVSAKDVRTLASYAGPGDCPPQYQYYATENKTPYCAVTGRTEEYIKDQLWSRIWYGSPTGQPYVEFAGGDGINQSGGGDFESLKELTQWLSDRAYLAKNLAIQREAEYNAAVDRNNAAVNNFDIATNAYQLWMANPDRVNYPETTELIQANLQRAQDEVVASALAVEIAEPLYLTARDARIVASAASKKIPVYVGY